MSNCRPPSPARLRLDAEALVSNWKALDAMSAGATGAAVKADGYGVGAREVVRRLVDAGCRDFFVANWAEAEAIHDLVDVKGLSVLNGVQPADVAFAKSLGAKPVLNSARQCALWRESGGGLCDVMFDSGMNRLGLRGGEIEAAVIDALDVDLSMSHLASADEDSPQNEQQLSAFRDLVARFPGRRTSLANSAGIALGDAYHFHLTRPGLALYGGIQRSELEGRIRQVVCPEVQLLQRTSVEAGDRLGYNATYTAKASKQIAIAGIGYADGYFRGFSNAGQARWKGQSLPVLGRVSMDLLIIDVDGASDLREGDWVEIAYALPDASKASGISQYELLTGLGQRFDRHWTD